MVKSTYQWAEGATLDDHSKRKHKILREYFKEYLVTRCKLPQQEKFRLAIVDGFAGAGIYDCGSNGSPLIFIEVLKETLGEINIRRAAQSLKLIEIECFFVFNDAEVGTVALLKENTAPLLAEIKANVPQLHIEVEYHTRKFDEVYPEIKVKINSGNYRNVLFNLDQYSHSHVSLMTIKDIMSSWRSAEVFLTFMIGALLAYVSPDREKDRALGKIPEVSEGIFSIATDIDSAVSKTEWLGKAEKIVFDTLKGFAPFSSPFSINNPHGWRYWFIHFANSYRARQVYNNILHANSSTQAHFGRSGLHMLSYDPASEGTLYLFDKDSRELAKKQLYDDVPRLISEYGDAISVEEFYIATYNETAAHSDDIHEMIMENPDVKVVTLTGGERRKANTIRPDDVLTIKTQKSFFPIFWDSKPKK
jgi:three-Cys-motif partner protein